MLKHFGLFGVVLVVITAQLPIVYAADTVTSGSSPKYVGKQTSSVDASNKFLSAEVQRQIDKKTDEMLEEMKSYQDENFRIWDQRMFELVDDLKMKIVIGGLGVILLGMGLTAFIMLKYFRRYSYEAFLEDELQKAQAAQQQLSGQYGGSFEQMQQTDWYPQQPRQTLGMERGQQWASDATQMNQWQAQPAYNGAWQSPVETVSQFDNQQYGRGQYSDDPMSR